MPLFLIILRLWCQPAVYTIWRLFLGMIWLSLLKIRIFIGVLWNLSPLKNIHSFLTELNPHFYILFPSLFDFTLLPLSQWFYLLLFSYELHIDSYFYHQTKWTPSLLQICRISSYFQTWNFIYSVFGPMPLLWFFQLWKHAIDFFSLIRF